jgi:hypothetical protein
MRNLSHSLGAGFKESRKRLRREKRQRKKKDEVDGETAIVNSTDDDRGLCCSDLVL